MFRYSNVFIATFIVSWTINIDILHGKLKRSDEASLHVVFGADVRASNVNSVRRRAAELASEDRYVFLKNWVLPPSSHASLRMKGEFTPTNPSPRAIEFEPHRSPTGQGGDFASPVFDLTPTIISLKTLGTVTVFGGGN